MIASCFSASPCLYASFLGTLCISCFLFPGWHRAFNAETSHDLYYLFHYIQLLSSICADLTPWYTSPHYFLACVWPVRQRPLSFTNADCRHQALPNDNVRPRSSCSYWSSSAQVQLWPRNVFLTSWNFKTSKGCRTSSQLPSIADSYRNWLIHALPSQLMFRFHLSLAAVRVISIHQWNWNWWSEILWARFRVEIVLSTREYCMISRIYSFYDLHWFFRLNFFNPFAAIREEFNVENCNFDWNCMKKSTWTLRNCYQFSSL